MTAMAIWLRSQPLLNPVQARINAIKTCHERCSLCDEANGVAFDAIENCISRFVR